MSGWQFSTAGRAVLRSLVPVICPPEAVDFADAIVDHVEASLSVAPVLVRAGFGTGLATYDLGALPRYRKRARALTGAAADAYFASWEHAPTVSQRAARRANALGVVQRQLVRAINQLMSLACYEQPAILERLGYRPGPWMEEVSHKRLTVYRDDVRRQEAQVLAPDPLRPGVVVGERRRRGG